MYSLYILLNTYKLPQIYIEAYLEFTSMYAICVVESTLDSL